VAGPAFLGHEASRLQEARPRHAATRVREAALPKGNPWWKSLLWLLGGMVLGIGLFLGWQEAVGPHPSGVTAVVPTATPRVVRMNGGVNQGDERSLARALAAAHDGDTILVPPGRYVGPLVLRDHVSLKATNPWKAIVFGDSRSLTDPGLGIVARGVNDVRVSGLRILGDEAHPLRAGILLSNSAVELYDVDVSGAIESGIRIDGESASFLLGSYVHGNVGAGVTVAGTAGGSPSVRIAGNRISENGRLASALKPGVELLSGARPVIENNVIQGNGIAGIPNLPADVEAELRKKNIVDGRPASVADVRRPLAAHPASAPAGVLAPVGSVPVRSAPVQGPPK